MPLLCYLLVMCKHLSLKPSLLNLCASTPQSGPFNAQIPYGVVLSFLSIHHRFGASSSSANPLLSLLSQNFAIAPVVDLHIQVEGTV